MNINWEMITVFSIVFISITGLGFWAARWQASDLGRLQEWGLAGRRFGSVISWFLIGGDVYTAYTFMAVPALVFGQGAFGFFAIPAFTLMYPVALVVMPRLWTVARHRGYITSADFVRERFGSSTLALCVSFTGILATMPYIAIQIYGIQVAIAQMGVPVEAALFISFAILAAYTYVSGLRGPALIAIVKDASIWIVTLATFGFIFTRLGGYQHIFSVVPQNKIILPPQQYSAYSTLILGSALALFLYPHAITGMLSTNSSKVVKRTIATLLVYTLLQASIGLLGFAAIASGIQSSAIYKSNIALPALFTMYFPPWFAGFAFATLAIGALVPSGIMSIGAANLFTRNIYREYIRPSCNEREEANVAKATSLAVKVGAMAFILFIPTTFIINLQLLGNVWIIQTLPAVFLGLYFNWFHRGALITGWFAGMLAGTWMVAEQGFVSQIVPFSFNGVTVPIYAALAALIINLVVCIALTPILTALGVHRGEDSTSPADYETYPVPVPVPSHETSLVHTAPLPLQPFMASQQQNTTLATIQTTKEPGAFHGFRGENNSW